MSDAPAQPPLGVGDPAVGLVGELGDGLVDDLLAALAATEVSFTVSDPTQPDNPLVWVNAAFTRTTGYSAGSALGRNCRFLQGPDTDPGAVDRLRRAIREGRSEVTTLLNHRADGTPFWNQVSVSPVRDAQGRLTAHVGVQVDVSDRVEAERAREQAAAAAAHASGRLALLAEATALLSATLDAGESLRRLADLVVPTLADACAVGVVEGDRMRVVAVSAIADDARRALGLVVRDDERLDEQVGPVARVLATGRGEVLTDPGRLELLTGPDRPGEPGDSRPAVGALVVVPLEAGGRLLGVMVLSRRSPVVEPRALELAVDLGRRAGLAHDNARLYALEHRTALTLQRSLLPSIPAVPGLDVAAHYLPSTEHSEVGGDWYDVLPLPDGAVGIAIGDVMGHDLQSAAAMGQLRSVLRAYAWEGGAPGEVLDRVDRLVQGLDLAQLATAVYARVERDGSGPTVVRYSRAGHLPPLLALPGGEVVRLDGAGSPVLGAPLSDEPRGEAQLPLPPGSVLVLCTDGLVEDRGSDLDTGLDRLERALREAVTGAPRRAAATAEAVARHLLAELAQAPLADDTALLVLRALDPPPTIPSSSHPEDPCR